LLLISLEKGSWDHVSEDILDQEASTLNMRYGELLNIFQDKSAHLLPRHAVGMYIKMINSSF
jgi:hypothetical protein